MLYGMADEAKAAYMDLVTMSDSMIGEKLGFNLHFNELMIRAYAPQLVNDSSYVENVISSFTNSTGINTSNLLERELYDAETQGRLAFQGISFILGMGISEGVAASKLSQANKGLSALDDTKQFWDDLARYYNKNNGTSSATGLYEHSLKAAESSELSYSSIIRKLREINTPEARATEKYIKKGFANLNFANYSDKAGYVKWGTNDITIARNVKINGKYYVQDLLSAAGTTGHESVHVMQKVAINNHSKLYELDAFMWQRNIDTRLQKNYSIEDLWNIINTHSVYKNEPFWNGLNKLDDLN